MQIILEIMANYIDFLSKKINTILNLKLFYYTQIITGFLLSMIVYFTVGATRTSFNSMCP